MVDWIIRVIKGVVISLGFILPGVSGGVLAAILGIYERMLRFMAHMRRDFVKNLLYFLPVGIGGIIGLILLSRPLEFVLERWQVPVLWGFAGAIIGSIPALIHEARSGPSTDDAELDSEVAANEVGGRSHVWLDGDDGLPDAGVRGGHFIGIDEPRGVLPGLAGRLDIVDFAWLIGTFALGGALLYALPVLAGTVPVGFGAFVLAGALIALGVLVPGLSPSNLLIILGLFTPMLQGFNNRDFLGVFLPIAIGAIITLLLFSKLMEHLLDRYHSRVFSLIIGLVLASTLLIVIPTRSPESINYAGATTGTFLAAAALFVAGLALGAWMSVLESKYKTVAPETELTALADPTS